MPCEVDTPTCDEFSSGAGSWHGWVGLYTDDDEGQACGCCCDIGCATCTESRETLTGSRVATSGHRWMRGSQNLVDSGIEAVTYDGRGSRGHIIAVKSNEGARRILPGIVLDKAPCYIEGGFECYDNPRGLCDCSDRPNGCGNLYGSVDGGAEPCNADDPCSGRRADAFTRKGFDWVLGDGERHCKDTLEFHEHIHHLFSKRMFSPVFVRDAYRRPSGNNWCGTNRMILCGGINIHSSTDPDCGYVNPFGETPPSDDHYISPHHTMFNFCTVDYQNLGLSNLGDPSPRELAVRELKRLALAKVREIPALSQLDYYPFVLPAVPSSNAHLDDWRRSFGFGVPGDSLIPQATVAVLPDCRLARAGTRVRVEYFIREAYVSMSLVPYMTQPDFGEQGILWPHARVRVYLIMGIRATFPDGNPTVGSGDNATTLSIDHPDDYLSPPRVTPGIDSIVYVDGMGREFIPPREVDWWGYHGEFGLGDWHGIDMVETDQSARNACCRAAIWLDGLEVEHWPTHADGGTVDSVFAGRVKLGFITSNWCANCNDVGHPDCNGAGGGAGGKPYIPPVGVQPETYPIGRPPTIAQPPRIEPEPGVPRQMPSRPVTFRPEAFRPVPDGPIIQNPNQPTIPGVKPPFLGPNEQGFGDADHSVWQN